MPRLSKEVVALLAPPAATTFFNTLAVPKYCSYLILGEVVPMLSPKQWTLLAFARLFLPPIGSRRRP